MNDVNLFWKVLEEEKIEKNDYYCPSFVFPLFPAGNPFAHTNSERIKSEFRFTGATFLSRATFSSVWLEAAAFFNGVTFMEPAVFSHFEVMEYADFSDTKFLGGINFSGIFYKEANFRNVMFSPDHPSSFHPYLASNPTYSVFRDTTYFTGINFPRSVAFRHVDLTHVSFGQSNLEEVTLQECLFNKVRGRNELYDERRYFKTSGGVIPRSYWGVMKGMYRQLKFNFESRKDWQNAGEFFISEMAMQRLILKVEANDLYIRMEDWSQNELLKSAPKIPWRKKTTDALPKIWTKVWWKKSLERLFLSGFGIVSFYGERPTRAFLWIALLVGAGAAGVYVAEGCADLSIASLVALRAVTFQQENGFEQLTHTTQWIMTLLRVGSAILLPLFLLALRRRFKR